jgi:ferredoxin-NADP reductase
VPQFHGLMAKPGWENNPFAPPFYTEIVTSDPVKFMAWVRRSEQLGYVEPADLEQFKNMLRAMSKKRDNELSQPYNPDPAQVDAERANKPSGKGQKPYPKRTYERDKKVVTSPWRDLPKGR